MWVKDTPVFPLITLKRDICFRNVFALVLFEKFSPSFILVYSNNKPGQAVSITSLFGKFFDNHVNTGVAGHGSFLCTGWGWGGVKKLRIWSDRDSIALFSKATQEYNTAGCGPLTLSESLSILRYLPENFISYKNNQLFLHLFTQQHQNEPDVLGFLKLFSGWTCSESKILLNALLLNWECNYAWLTQTINCPHLVAAL